MKFKYILTVLLFVGSHFVVNAQGEVIISCPDNYDEVLCETWLKNKYLISDILCENGGATVEYEIGYYLSPSFIDKVFYYEKLFCCDTEGIDPCEYIYYDCNGNEVETYHPETFGPFGGPAYVENEYFPEFGSNASGINFPSDDMMAMFIEDGNNFPNCDNVDIDETRVFCLINPSFVVTQDISYVCGVDGNIYQNLSIAQNCYGINMASDPLDCNFICGNGSVEAGEEEDGCGGEFCPPCNMMACPSDPDTLLCQTWLFDIINSTTCDFSNPQNYNYFKVYTVPYQGDTSIIINKEQFVISDGTNEFTLYSCAGDTIYECSQGIFGDCNDLGADPIFGPIINDTVLIYDCRVDMLDCPDNNPFNTVQSITVDQSATNQLPGYAGCDTLLSNTSYLNTENVFTFMLIDNLDFTINSLMSVEIISNGSVVNSVTFQDTILASTGCVWGWWDAGQFDVGDYVVKHYIENTFTHIKYQVGESNFLVIDTSTQLPFITTWKTDNLGSSCNSCITIPTSSDETYNYDVDWDNDGTFDEFGITSDVTHDFNSAGVYTIAIRGQFPHIKFILSGENNKIIDIKQWGSIEWASMENAFYDCENLNSTAIDSPNLSNVTNFRGIFNGASSFNGSIGNWDVSNVNSMESAFKSASAFNQNLDNWDVSNVTNMGSMFVSATSFNGIIESWNVSNVTNMANMFSRASSFNSDLSNWDVSNVISMHSTFFLATSFNSDLSNWDMSNIESTTGMFQNATSFNSDLSNWNMSNVTSMNNMFFNATTFDSDIDGWDVSNVTNFNSAFRDASSFNQSLESWSINSASDVEEMFNDSGLDCTNYSSTLIGWAANTNIPNNLILGSSNLEYGTNAISARDQLIAKGWTINGDTQGSCGTVEPCSSDSDSILCYDWLNQMISNTDFCQDPGPSAITYKVYTTEHNDLPAILIDNNFNCINPTIFGAAFTLYDCDGNQIESCSYQGFETCSNPPTDNPIIGPAYDIAVLIYDSEVDVLPACSTQRPFITTWKTDNSGTSCPSCITIPTFSGETYNYDVDWENDGVYDEFGISGDVTHDFTSEGTYTIAIKGEFPRIYFNNSGDKEKIINIDQWGDIEWSSMHRAFNGCSNLNSDAVDSPDLSSVTDLSYMFREAAQFNGNISNWDVSNVNNMEFMFSSASSFNQPIGNWNVSNVMDMSFMFGLATSFNQPLNNWNTSSVTTMNAMFIGATLFNQTIGNWDVSKVTNMHSMFREAENFNQNINDWQVGQVKNMTIMFGDAISFNQPLNQWDVGNVTEMNNMFNNAKAFDQSLQNWNVSEVTDMAFMFRDAASFNQPIDSWNVSKVTRLNGTFLNASSFNQNIGGWNIGSVSELNNMLDDSGLDCTNYTTTLQGWANNSSTPSAQTLGALNIEYGNEAQNARDSLINVLSWSISGDIDLGTDCSDCGPGSCLAANPPVWIDTLSIPDITVSCVSDVPILLSLGYSNGQSADCLIEGEIIPNRDESNFDGCSGTIVDTWNYTTDCGDTITPYSRTITVSSQGNLVFDDTPEPSITISCDDIGLYGISLDYMIDQGNNCIPGGTLDPVITNNYDACGGFVIFTWTVTEPCLGTLEFIQTANILPNNNFQFTDLPKDLILDCDDLPFEPEILTVSNGIEGNCAANEQIVATTDPMIIDCPGTITNSWTYTNPCTNIPIIHEQKITLVDCAPPTLEEDYIEVRAGNPYMLNLFDNDLIPDSFSIVFTEVERQELFATSILEMDGSFEFVIEEAFFDTLRLTYEVCNLKCDVCSTNILKIVDEALKDIFLTDIITPDGDGINDKLRFNFETQINNAHLLIFNRWGTKIYENENYNNDWDASGYPGGIYYYVLRLGSVEVKKTLTIVK